MSNIIYERCKAQVKFYSRDKGYGFLKRDNKKPDVFFSATALQKANIENVRENDWIEFDLMPVPGKGGKATNLKLIKD